MFLFIDYTIWQRSPTSLKARERQQNGGLCYCSMEYIRPLRLCRIVLTPQVSDCCLQIEQRVPCHRYEICQVSDLQYPHTPECPTLPNTQTLKKFGISLGLPCVSLCV